MIYQVTITVSPKANGDGDLQKELKASSDEHGVVLKDIWLDEVLLDRLIQQHERLMTFMCFEFGLFVNLLQ